MLKIYNAAKLLYHIQVALNHTPMNILTNLFYEHGHIHKIQLQAAQKIQTL